MREGARYAVAHDVSLRGVRLSAVEVPVPVSALALPSGLQAAAEAAARGTPLQAPVVCAFEVTAPIEVVRHDAVMVGVEVLKLW